MRVYLCGQKHFGAEAFKALRSAGHEVVGVSSPPWANERLSRLSETGERPDRLRSAADLAGVPWRSSGGLTAATLPDGVDLIIAAHSHDFVGARTRAKARLGAIGYHPSLLPLHRGRDAVRWAVRMGDRVTGGSVYWLTDAVDGGPIAAQDWCFVRPDDTAESLWRRDLAPMGVRLLLAVVGDLQAGVAVMVPQDEGLATWEPSLSSPPLFRPELPAIGRREGVRVIADAEGARGHAAGRGSGGGSVT